MLKFITILIIAGYCEAIGFIHGFGSGSGFGSGFGLGADLDAFESFDSYGDLYGGSFHKAPFKFGKRLKFRPSHGYHKSSIGFPLKLTYGLPRKPSYGLPYLPSDDYEPYDSYRGHDYISEYALKRNRKVEVRPLQTYHEPLHPQVIKVDGLDPPIKVVYNSKPSRVHVQQQHHKGEPLEIHRSRSEEHPQVVIHEIIKPVIQEIREVILPYRRVIQKIEPVVEDIQTVVAKGEPNQGSYGTRVDQSEGLAYGGLSATAADIGKDASLGAAYESFKASSKAASKKA